MFTKIPLKKLLKHCNPVRNPPWNFKTPITKKEISKALNNETFNKTPDLCCSTRQDHINRIAFLIRYGWSDPIEIEVGAPSFGCWADWLIWDGNHRVIAAYFKGDEIINASVGGELDYAEELFGVPCK